MTAPTLGQRRAKKRKTEILEAALAVLTEDGYAHASMDKIAERALLTRVGLYKHFKDKTSLMVALRAHKLLELAKRVEEVLRHQTGFEAQIRALVKETVQYQRENQGFFQLLLALSFSADVEADLSLKPYLYTVVGVFEAGLRQGVLRQADPLECAGLLTTLTFQPSIKPAFSPEGFSPAPNIEGLIADVFLNGVLKS